jgi:small subunit ribosomal protein S20
VAHTLSAKKRIRQNLKRRGRNRWRKAQIRDVVKAYGEALRKGDRDEAAERLRAVYKKLDQVAAKGTIHKNAAARRKSRLAKRLKELDR